MEIDIRIAEERDLEGILSLLHQVNDVHAAGRPDLFVKGCTKYNEVELLEIIRNPKTPVFVGIDPEGGLAGYCFCVVEDHSKSNNLQPIKTLYIDDLCVDERERGKHVGQTLYAFVKDYARENGFYNVTLNVWSCNPSAQRFYEKLGLKPMKVGMEEIL